MYKNHIWFGSAHENLRPKKKNPFFQESNSFIFQLGGPRKGSSLKDDLLSSCPHLCFNLKTQMNEFALPGRWQHCAPCSGEERPPKTSRVKCDALRLGTIHVSPTAPACAATPVLEPTTSALTFRSKVLPPLQPASALLF